MSDSVRPPSRYEEDAAFVETKLPILKKRYLTPFVSALVRETAASGTDHRCSKKSLGVDTDEITREGRLTAAVKLSKRVGVAAACRGLNVSRATFYRRRQPQQAATPRPTPSRALPEAERQNVLEQLNSERFADQSPRQVYAKLLDEERSGERSGTG